MFSHLSIEADCPAYVAGILTELAGGGRSPLVEVRPRGTVLHEARGATDAHGVADIPRRPGPSYIAIATPLDPHGVIHIARREGWPVKYRKRGGAFGVIELWIEGCQMIEVLTPDMQREYQRTMRIGGWNQALEVAGAPVPA